MKHLKERIKTVLLVALIFGLACSLVNATATINVYFGDLPANAYYTIKTDGTNIWAVRYDGYKASESTSASTVINYALTNLTPGRTYPETIICRGSFTITAKLVVSSYTTIIIDGKWTKDFDGTLLENADRATYNQDMTIAGFNGEQGRIYGNSATHTGTGIDILCPTSAGSSDVEPMCLTLKNMVIENFNGIAVKINNNGANMRNIITECNINSVTNHALYLYGVQETEVMGGLISCYDQSNTYYAIYIYNIAASRIMPRKIEVSDCRAIYIEASLITEYSITQIDGAWHDNWEDHFIYLYTNCHFNNFHDIMFRVNFDSASPNTYDGIYMNYVAGNTHHNNRFCNIYGGRLGGTGTKTMRYVINEVNAGNDYNTYCNIDGLDCATGALHILGTHSKVVTNSTLGTIVWD